MVDPTGAHPDAAASEVVVTGPSPEWATELTTQLVEAKLAACGHTIHTITAVYHWQGVTENETQTRLALHTRTTLVPELTEAVKATHPDDVPCVIALPIHGGNPDYLQWIIDETRDPA
jgi:periplasmic divalent cation tolerance protein